VHQGESDTCRFAEEEVAEKIAARRKELTEAVNQEAATDR